MKTQDFWQEAANGKTSHLADYRCKEVLLALWSLDDPKSLDTATLKAIQHQNRL